MKYLACSAFRYLCQTRWIYTVHTHINCSRFIHLFHLTPIAGANVEFLRPCVQEHSRQRELFFSNNVSRVENLLALSCSVQVVNVCLRVLLVLNILEDISLIHSCYLKLNLKNSLLK